LTITDFLKQTIKVKQEMTYKKALVFDTETSGLPLTPRFGEYYATDDLAKYASSRIVQIAWQVVDLEHEGAILRQYQTLVAPQGKFQISPGSESIHGISQAKADVEGIPVLCMMQSLCDDLEDVDVLVAHNLMFDLHILVSEVQRAGQDAPAQLMDRLTSTVRCCTMRTTTVLCNLSTSWGAPKWPKLIELHRHLFEGEEFDGAHDALCDVSATTRCLVELIRNKHIMPPPTLEMRVAGNGVVGRRRPRAENKAINVD